MQKHIIGAIVFLALCESALSIRCYVCNATSSPFQCGELFERYDEPDIEPQDCSAVHGAQYCIKHIGRFEACSLKCYQCAAGESIECSDVMINQPDSPLKPEPCDHVIDAKYCIKSTARNGGIGAKRYCSSKHLGNYCDFVQNVGDQREYRSCIFTCGSDGCNGSSALKSFTFSTIVLGSLFAIMRFN